MKWKEYLLVLIFLSTILLNGCSLIGLGVGIYASADEEVFNQESNILPVIEPNEAIRVITTSKDTIRGNFINISRIPFDVYAQKYKEAKKQLSDSINLPQIGEVITYTRIIEKISWQQSWQQSKEYVLEKHDKKFYGFGFGSILLGDTNYDSAEVVKLSTINNLSNNHFNKIEIKKIAPLIHQGKIPLVSELNINNNSIYHAIPEIDIKKVEIESFGGWWFIGLITGLAIDAAIISQIEFRMDWSGMEKRYIY